MRRATLLFIFGAVLLFSTYGAEDASPKAPLESSVGQVTSHSQGLHGYIGFGHERLPSEGGYTAGMGFYAAVWPLVDQSLADFQIGLPGSWIQPDNSDNKDTPLAPEGTLARQWKARGPTWSSVFQTVEGGLGYWARNHFRYGPPKFSMNATPQCYDYEIGSPGWSFFYSNEALPDNRLGIAQLSNRLLIPPDALPFQGNPNGEFLGYSWMALPFTDPTGEDPPTGDQSWTCFLSAANFKGPIAYYIPETWSKIGKLFKYPFLYGRGLDARPGVMGGGAMEINTVPRFDATDAQGTTYSKLPKLQWPVDREGRAFLVQDVTYYSKAALYEAFKSWRDGGAACSGIFSGKGAFQPKLSTRTTRYDQAGKKIVGVERAFDTRIFDGNVWGLQWFTNDVAERGLFPEYYKHVGEERIAVGAEQVPAETKLHAQQFKLARPGVPYTSPSVGAWARPGPKVGPFTAKLVDGSIVTYSWYRFIDQPSFQQYNWTAEKRAKLQALVEKLHANWPADRDYMAPPTRGKLVSLDPALLVTPPPGLGVGYVPIVIRQERAQPSQDVLGRLVTQVAAVEPLYTQEGSDPPFAEVLKGGGIKPGERSSPGPVPGSRIDVNHRLLEKQVGKTGPIPRDISIHTQGSGSISRKDFAKWTRWYQEDDDTQVFRLFEGEQNVRGGIGKDGSPGRVEAFSRTLTVNPGTWREWEGTYTFIVPINACIFQLMHEGNLWPFHVEMSVKGDISFLRRRPVPGLERVIAIAENMVGKSLSIKVRANGEDYEVYQKTPLDTGPWKLVTKGSFTRANENKISFRWGMYAGSKKGETIQNNALIFVTGATIR